MGDMNSGSFSIDSDIDAGGALLCLVLAFFVGRYYHNRFYPLTKRYRTTVPRFWAGVVDQAVLFPSKFLYQVYSSPAREDPIVIHLFKLLTFLILPVGFA